MKLRFSYVMPRGNYALFLFSLWQQVGRRKNIDIPLSALVALWKHKTVAQMCFKKKILHIVIICEHLLKIHTTPMQRQRKNIGLVYSSSIYLRSLASTEPHKRS